ncbi:MAG: hypothetical protein HBSAPP03_27470 [Phycisphaerae bacterium]|nr:MAG: hypothetical protein HBSAPP03_27470 [Phycisphaerae bacterium]
MAVLDVAMLASRVAVTAGVIASILGLGWLDVVRAVTGDLILIDELLAIAPALAFIILTWWSYEPIERRLREALLWRELHDPAGVPVHPIPSRAVAVWHHTRHGLLVVVLPLSAILAWSELIDRVWPEIAARATAAPAWMGDALHYLGILAVLIVTPLAIRVVWNTVPIGPGSVRTQALAVAAKYRVRVRGPYLWRTHGSTVNAAILGIVYPLRYMLFTDALLERLTERQVEGVIAHEVAHVKLRHMLWLALVVLACALAFGWVLEAIAPLVHAGPAWDVWGAVLGLGATLFVFGVVSRRFEWQADAFALRHLSGPSPIATPDAADCMAGALGDVAALNGASPTRFGFRHGSIHDRQSRLRRLAGAPLDQFPIDRHVRLIKAITLTVLVLALLTSAAMMLR